MFCYFRPVLSAGRMLVLLGLAALLSACAGRVIHLPANDSLQHLSPSVIIDQVPFYAQDAYQCGPASLAMMLNYRGLTTTPEMLKERVYIPQRRGSLQIELVAAAREHDLLVYPVPRKLEAILTELEAGNPVLVMQNLAVKWLPQWHYAVVIGYDLNQQLQLLSSVRDQVRGTNLPNQLQPKWLLGAFGAALAAALTWRALAKRRRRNAPPP